MASVGTAVAQALSGGVNSYSWSVDATTNTGRFMYLFLIAYESGGPFLPDQFVNYAGADMGLHSTYADYNTPFTGNLRITVYRLQNPASGPNLLQVQWVSTGSVPNGVLIAVPVYGHPSGSSDNISSGSTNSGTSVTDSVTSASGDLILQAVNAVVSSSSEDCTATGTPTPTRLAFVNNNGGVASGAVLSAVATTGSSTTEGWTLAVSAAWSALTIGLHDVGTSPPTLSAVSPSSANRSTTASMTLTGTGFSASTPTVNLSGSGVTVNSVVAVNDTTITCNFVVAGNAPSGAQNVTVTTVNGTSGSQTFTVNNNPRLTSISPTSGYANPTVNVKLVGVTINGIGFNGTTPSVNVPSGLAASNLSVVNDTQLTFDLTINAGTSPASDSISVTTSVTPTSNSVSFSISNPSGSASSSMRGGFVN